MPINPYTDRDFFGFFTLLFSRCYSFFTGQLHWHELATDEVQMIVLGAVGVTGAMVGTFLVLRQMAMLANALSHTILLGIVVAYFISPALTIPVLMIAALITGIATTFMTDFLNRVIKLQEDASIGLVFSLLFALGILLLTLFSRNVHVGTELVMGNVDALQKGDIKLVVTVMGVNGALFFILYYGFKITTFDPNLARAFGFSPLLFNYLLMVQTSATAIGAFKAVGVLMVLAFLILPPLTARRLTNRLSSMIGWAAFIGLLAALIGVALSRHVLTFWGVGLSTGGLVVIVLGLLYGSSLFIERFFTRSLLAN
jgi:manganese/zinc/iron transport system permease protein